MWRFGQKLDILDNEEYPREAGSGTPLTCGEGTQLFRVCSVSSQSMWIGWDWMGLNPKQVKLLLNFFQSHPIHMYWE
jgi:hypothetical protein